MEKPASIPTIAYATSQPLDTPGSPCRIEQNDDGLFITIPPPRLWILIVGPAIGLMLTCIPLVFLIALAVNSFRTIILEFAITSAIWLSIILLIASYNLRRLVQSARFGRKSIHIAVTKYALSVERGGQNSITESLPMSSDIVVWKMETSPTLTLGKVVSFRFTSPENEIAISFFTRQWKLGRQLSGLLQQHIVKFAPDGDTKPTSGSV